MQIDRLTREGNHVHFYLLDDNGNEIRQVDRDLTSKELRGISVGKKSINTVVAETEGAEIVKTETREKAASSVVVHVSEPHRHDEYLTAIPEHTHDEIKNTEDYLTRRLKELEGFVSGVQDTLRVHSHPQEPHEHDEYLRGLPEHKHPHTHDELSDALAKLQELVTKLSADVATALTEHDHTAILSRVMSVESEAKTISGLLVSHSHDHTHPEFAAIRGELQAVASEQNARIEDVRISVITHGHPLPAHDHPHEHQSLKASVDRIEAKSRDLELADAAILERLSKVDATHRHMDVDEELTTIVQDVGTVKRELAKHDHPHEHKDVVERFARLDEKLAGHMHDDYASKEHSHVHEHAEIADLKKVVEAIDVKVIALANRVLNHDHDGRYLKEIPVHEHAEYLSGVPEHDHKRYDERIDEHLVTVKAQTQLRVLSREEVGGKVRLIVEEVT